MRLRGLPEDERLDRFDDVPFKLFAADGKTLLSKAQWPIYRALSEEMITEEDVIIESALGVRKHLLISGKAIFDTNGEKLGAYISMRPYA